MKKLFLVMAALALLSLGGVAYAFTAYNDCVHGGSPANTTIYSAYMGDGGGFETPSGLLKDFATGANTSVTATLTGSNISGSTSAAPSAGTDAYNVFNGKVNLGDSSVSYNSSQNWYYQVVFTGLDPSKSYEFVTTANRGGSYSTERWTKFTIIGADAYTNLSSTGVSQVAPDVLNMNTGNNTAAGRVIRWTGISAADGSFTVISQNVGISGPGETYKSYGMEGFMLQETVVPEPSSIIALFGGLISLIGIRIRRA